MPAVSDAVWSAQGTTPDAIEAALRDLLKERHAENGGYVPARVLNMVRSWTASGAARSPTACAAWAATTPRARSCSPTNAGRERLDARASVASEGDPAPGELALLRETVMVEIGERHLDDLVTIADPLVVSDMPTLLWSPHGHPEAVRRAAGAGAGGAAGLDRRARAGARRWRARRPRAAGLRGGSGVAALDAVARAHRGRLRPARDAPPSCRSSRS